MINPSTRTSTKYSIEEIILQIVKCNQTFM